MACNAIATVRALVEVEPNIDILREILQRLYPKHKWEGGETRYGGKYVRSNHMTVWVDGKDVRAEYPYGYPSREEKETFDKALLAAQKATLMAALKKAGKIEAVKDVNGATVFQLKVKG